MKKTKILSLGLLSAGMLMFATSCGSKTEEAKTDSIDAEEPVANVETVVYEANTPENIAEIFADANNRAPQASDTTFAVTPSGLRYLTVREGKGAQPTATDNVTVHYEGRLLDGTVFDSSYQRGEPTSFPLNQVIPGWTEGLQLMREGGKTIFYIPSELGYGSRDLGTIPPNSDLIFTVELIKVN